MRAVAWTLALLLCSAPVLAQQAKTSTAPKLQKVEEVERGFWLRANLGFAMAVTDMFEGDRQSDLWPPGALLQVEAGYDFGQIASIHLGLQGEQVVGSLKGTKGTVSNDATMLVILAGGRFNLMTTKRLAWYLKANAGWMLTVPELVGLSSGVLVGGGTGIEYATMLRHFFVGLEIGGSYDLANGGVLVALTPSLKYVF